MRIDLAKSILADTGKTDSAREKGKGKEKENSYPKPPLPCGHIQSWKRLQE